MFSIVPRSRLVPVLPRDVERALSFVAGIEPVASQATFPVDVHESTQAYTVEVDVPGVDISQISLEAQDKHLVLTIQKREEEPASDRFHRQERRRVHGRRAFVLPKDVQRDAISAHLVNGVLTLRLPRQAPPPPAVRAIEIQTQPAPAEVAVDGEAISA